MTCSTISGWCSWPRFWTFCKCHFLMGFGDDRICSVSISYISSFMTLKLYSHTDSDVSQVVEEDNLRSVFAMRLLPVIRGVLASTSNYINRRICYFPQYNFGIIIIFHVKHHSINCAVYLRSQCLFYTIPLCCISMFGSLCFHNHAWMTCHVLFFAITRLKFLQGLIFNPSFREVSFWPRVKDSLAQVLVVFQSFRIFLALLILVYTKAPECFFVPHYKAICQFSNSILFHILFSNLLITGSNEFVSDCDKPSLTLMC